MCFYFSHLTCTFHFNCCLNKIFVIVIVIVINNKIETANKVLGIMRRSFLYLSADILLPLYKALVRSHFD